MLKSYATTIIIVLGLSACNSLPQRTADTPVQSDSTKAISDNPAPDSRIRQTVETTIDDSVKVDIVEAPQYNDVWQRIRDNLSLPAHLDKSSVKAKVAWYARHQAYLDRVADRAQPYIYHIVEELEKRNMPTELALLPIVESAYHPFAYSRSHASGIWQFIPSTGKHYGLKQNWWYDGRRDIVAATDGALRYLAKLHKEFNGNWLHALAAYNTGERNVARAIARNKRAGKPTDFWSLRLPRETRGYVPSLLAAAELLRESQQYGVSWKLIENKPYFEQIDVQKQIDLATVAELAELSMDEVYTLNPAFNRWATDPDGPHSLLIPLDKKDAFLSGLANLGDKDRITWNRHVIKRGESLGLIATKYHTSVSALKQTNDIRGNLIREGQSLLIPSSKQPQKHYTLSLDSRRYKGLKKSGDGKNHIYTVRRGDTLWDIGRHYGVSLKELYSWNGLHSRSILRPGKKLNLWLTADAKKTAKAVPVNYKNNDSGLIKYTVRRGDSLWIIAKRHNVTVKQLLSLNGLSKNKHLRPGQQLIIQNEQSSITGA